MSGARATQDATEADELARLLRTRIRDVPDFPSPGIVFRDIAPLLADPRAFGAAVDAIAGHAASGAVAAVAGIEARGFILGAAVAYRCGAGFVPVRKAGKLPSPTFAATYALEYGSATLEVPQAAFGAGDRVLVVDDVLATGGTAQAAAQLIRRTGAEVVGCSVLLELPDLDGRARLQDLTVRSLLVI